jgi:hypothetical protein
VLLTPLAFPDWPSASFFSTSLVEEAKPVDFLKLYIPANPFASLANGVVPAIAVFSILIGVALIRVKNKRVLLEPLSAIAEGLMGATGFVARLAPYGVFALTASAAGTLDLEERDRLQVYVVIYVMMAIILSFWVLPALATIVTPLRYADLVRALRGALITAFAAGSVLIVLPLLAEECKKLMDEGRESDGDEALDGGCPHSGRRSLGAMRARRGGKAPDRARLSSLRCGRAQGNPSADLSLPIDRCAVTSPTAGTEPEDQTILNPRTG